MKVAELPVVESNSDDASGAGSSGGGCRELRWPGGQVCVVERTAPVPSARARAEVGVLFDAHVDAIHGYLARRLGSEVAEDATSEVFRLALEHFESFDSGRGSALGWLYGIAGNVVRRHWRTEQRRLRHLSRAAGLVDAGRDDDFERVDARLDALALEASVLDAVAALSADDRELLVLFAWEQLSYAQIATALDVAVGTVRSRLHRIRGDLRHSVQRGEGDR